MVSPLFSSALDFLALGLSVVLLFAVAYLWSSNSTKTAELARIQKEMQRMKKTLGKLEVKVNEIREPKVIADVPQVEPFGLNLAEASEPAELSERLGMRMTPLAPQDPWLNFVEEYNDLASNPTAPGLLKKCERFINDNKLKILTYGGAMTFRPAIDAKDSGYWAFKCSGDEFAVVPNPLNPCDEEFHEYGGIKEIFALNYEDGVYRKYFVKLPAIFSQDSARGWQLKNTGVVNLARK